MPKDPIRGAFVAWQLAIQARLNGNKDSCQELAEDYGLHITNKESLTEVALWFNWPEITRALERYHAKKK